MPASWTSIVNGRTARSARTVDRNVRVSAQDNPIFRRATLVISFSTCTLIVPPPSISFSALSALAASPEATYSNTLVSKKLPGIGLVPVELEIRRQVSAEGAEPLQQLGAAGLARHAESAVASDMNLDLVAFLEAQ